VSELQILRDELDVDQTNRRRIFRSQRLSSPFFLRDRAAHLDDIAGDRPRIARTHENSADHLLDARRKCR